MNSYTWDTWLSIINSVSLASLCFIVGIVRWKYLPKSFRLLPIEAIGSLLSDVLSIVILPYDDVVKNCYSLVLIFCMVFSSYSLLPHKTAIRIYSIVIPIYLAGWITSIYKYGFNLLANYSLVIGLILVTITYLITTYYAELGLKESSKKPVRLIVFGIILYHAGTSVFFSMIVYFFYKKGSNLNIIYLHHIIDVTRFIMITYGMYLFKKYKLEWRQPMH